MKKRVFASLLTLVLALSLLPTSVFAYVGPIRTTESERVGVDTFTLTNGGFTYLCLQNDYITFAVQASGSGSSLRSYTVPTGQLNGNNSSIFNFPAEINRFSVSEGNTENVGGARSMNITSIRSSTDSSSGYTTVTVMLGFSDSRLEGGLTFYLERVNRGGGEGTSKDSDTISVDQSEDGSHWAVASATAFALTETGKSQLGSDGSIYPYHIKEYPLSTMGHANGGSGAPLMLSAASEMWEQYGGSSYSSFVYVDYYTQNIASGLSRTPTEWKNTFTEYDFTNNYYTEAYTTNYASANPFVGLSSFYYTDSIGVEGVEGHDYAFYPQQIESNGSSLTTYGYDPNDPLATGDNMDSCSFSSIWGFRDLFGPNDMAPSNPDAVAVSGDTLYVTVSGGDVRVSPAYSGSAVATIRGEFSEAADGYYNFTKGAAALSPTVTATWGDGGHFRVSQTGTFDFENISLNAPSFKFFSPEETSGTSGLGLSY